MYICPQSYSIYFVCCIYTVVIPFELDHMMQGALKSERWVGYVGWCESKRTFQRLLQHGKVDIVDTDRYSSVCIGTCIYGIVDIDRDRKRYESRRDWVNSLFYNILYILLYINRSTLINIKLVLEENLFQFLISSWGFYLSLCFLFLTLKFFFFFFYFSVFFFVENRYLCTPTHQDFTVQLI